MENREDWDKHSEATDENAHLMVQCMEAWFLADKNALANYYGKGFNENSLPRRIEIEQVPKSDIEEGLKMATRQCTKGRYDKGSHSFAILAELNPEKVIAASRMRSVWSKPCRTRHRRNDLKLSRNRHIGKKVQMRTC